MRTFKTPPKQNLEENKKQIFKGFSQPFHQREETACMCVRTGLLSKLLATSRIYKVLIRTLSLLCVPEIGLKFLPSTEHIPEVVK